MKYNFVSRAKVNLKSFYRISGYIYTFSWISHSSPLPSMFMYVCVYVCVKYISHHLLRGFKLTVASWQFNWYFLRKIKISKTSLLLIRVYDFIDTIFTYIFIASLAFQNRTEWSTSYNCRIVAEYFASRSRVFSVAVNGNKYLGTSH